MFEHQIGRHLIWSTTAVYLTSKSDMGTNETTSSGPSATAGASCFNNNNYCQWGFQRYFFSNVLQFQIHRAMCTVSRQYDPLDPSKPLHKCDIFRQPAAGNILKKLMERGASEPWQQVLQEVIGEGRLDGTALREYFKPLEEWLRNENLRTNEFVGWIYDGDYCKHSIETANLQVFGGFYNAGVQLQLSASFVIGLYLFAQTYLHQLRLI